MIKEVIKKHLLTAKRRNQHFGKEKEEEMVWNRLQEDNKS